MEVPVSFRCKRCGTKLTWTDDAVDITELFCSNCREHFGTYADLRQTAIEGVKSRIESVIKGSFKR
jgi:hypothetical protein